MSTPKVQVLGQLNGLSAYEIAVKNGFEGDEKAWLASLAGGDRVYTIPYYDSYTESQKQEVINMVNTIKADTGDYAVFVKSSSKLLPAQIDMSNSRQTLVTAIEHNTTGSYIYALKVTSSGVTPSKSNFFVSDGLDMEKGEYLLSAPTSQAVMQYVHQYIEENAVEGPPGEPGYTPVKGKDYYTEEDKAEMVNAVLSTLPTWEGGSY